jgi:hypothetical protein
MVPSQTGSLLALFVLAWVAPARGAVELRLDYTALERMLAQQVFTQEGRKYVRGTADSKCSFAYLEHPKIGADGSRLRIDAKFSGRSARNVFGSCFGLGDSFDLRITAVPWYDSGWLRLRDVRVESRGRTGFYIRAVCSAMSSGIPKDFKYDLSSEAKRILEERKPGSTYEQHLDRFGISAIHVTSNALVLVLDFTLTVK